MPDDELHRSSGVAIAAVDRLAHLGPDQIDDHGPTRSKDVDMRRRMIVRIDNDAKSVTAQNRWHILPIP